MISSNHALVALVASIVGVAAGYGIGFVRLSPESVPTPATESHMGDAMADMTGGLEGKTGDAFDEAFIDEMILHHEGAVEMAELAKMHSERPEILKLADDIIKAQTGEIDMMTDWKYRWFTGD